MAVLLQHFGCGPVVPLTTFSHPGGSSSARPAHAHSAAEPALRDHRLRIGLPIQPHRALTQLDRILPVRCHCKLPSSGLARSNLVRKSPEKRGKHTPSASTRGRRQIRFSRQQPGSLSPEGQQRIGVVGPDLAPDLFQERGKGQQFGAGRSSPQVCSETSQQAWPLERVSMRLAARPAPRQRRR